MTWPPGYKSQNQTGYKSGLQSRPVADQLTTSRIMASSLAKSIGLVMWAVNPASRLRRMSSSMP